jgi:predicted DNA-binding ribbon-helix-helix protein
MKSPVVKRSIVVAGHKTSVSLEEAFWNGMKEISGRRNMTLSELVGEIDGAGLWRTGCSRCEAACQGGGRL